MHTSSCIMLALAVVAIFGAPGAWADLTMEHLVGNWTGYCFQFAATNAGGDVAYCTPKDVRILYNYSVTFMPSGEVHYSVGGTSTTHNNITYMVDAIQYEPANIKSMTPFNKNSACVATTDGVHYVSTVKGNTYMEHGYLGMDNVELEICPNRIKAPVCHKGLRFSYECVATRDAM